MSLGHGYDYSVPSLIPLDAVAESGAQFVGRYLDGGNGLRAADRGDPIGAVWASCRSWSTEAERPTTVRKRGAPRLADNLCDNLGVPLDVPIVHCDDFNDPVDHEPEFFRRVVAASRRPVMMYGSLRLARAVADMGVKYFWIVGTGRDISTDTAVSTRAW